MRFTDAPEANNAGKGNLHQCPLSSGTCVEATVHAIQAEGDSIATSLGRVTRARREPFTCFPAMQGNLAPRGD